MSAVLAPGVSRTYARLAAANTAGALGAAKMTEIVANMWSGAAIPGNPPAAAWRRRRGLSDM